MTFHPALPTSLFMERIIRFLLPYFTAICPDPDLVRQEIMETLASYGPRSRSEMLGAAQIIALGFAALGALQEAGAADIPAPLRLRFLGCANSLNRSCRLNEKSLARQQAADVPLATPTADPVDNLADAETEAVIRQAQAAIQARCASNRPAGAPSPVTDAPPAVANPPPAVANTATHNRVWGGAMMDALAAMGMPVQPVPATSAVPS